MPRFIGSLSRPRMHWNGPLRGCRRGHRGCCCRRYCRLHPMIFFCSAGGRLCPTRKESCRGPPGRVFWGTPAVPQQCRRRARHSRSRQPEFLNSIVLGGIAGRPGNADAAVPFALAVLGRGRSPAGTTAPGGLRNPEPRRTTHWRGPGSVSVTLTLISIAAVVVVPALVEWLLLRLVHGPLRSPPASSSQKT